MNVDLRLGRWQEVLADVGCDVLITDPPYSGRTHAGHDRGADYRSRVARPSGGTGTRQSIDYSAWTEDDVNAFIDHWGPRTRGWICVLTDHILAPCFEAALRMKENGDRYVFAPIPIVEIGSRVRLSGDGPSSWTCWLVVARPRSHEFAKWGTLPGAYIGKGRGDRQHIGGKDSGIMKAIVRDYSRTGDLVCDPCAGAGTTLLSAASEGRKAIGAEMDPATHAKAAKRLAGGFTPPLVMESARSEQSVLFGEVAQ